MALESLISVPEQPNGRIGQHGVLLRQSEALTRYALMQENSPVALIEAKKLGEPLASGIEQALNYCNRQGTNYMVVTDGDRWELYEVFRQARIEDRKLTSYSIQNDGAYVCALKVLHFWQPNLRFDASIIKLPDTMIAGTALSLSPVPPTVQGGTSVTGPTVAATDIG